MRTGNDPHLAARDTPGDHVLAPGERGDDVRALQARLNAHGVRDARGRPLPLTGNYLQRTQAAVREFQRIHGLPTTGVADDATRTALARPAVLLRGDRGHAVAHLQRVLQRAGHDLLVSGEFDARTEAAVRAFQRERRLGATGIADARTLRHAWRVEATASTSTAGSTPVAARVRPTESGSPSPRRS